MAKQLLFIPGIKGTELWQDGNRRWFPKNIDDVNVIASDSAILVGDRLIRRVVPYGIKKFTKVIYEGVLDKFGRMRNFDIYPYDWRKSIFEHVDRLVNRIIALSNQGDEVILICHSMGGILGKLAILELHERGLAENVTSFITIGTPWLGSPDAYKALMYGEPGFYHGLKSIFPMYSEERTREMARKFPSVYQLLPSEAYYQYRNFTGHHKTYGDFLIEVQGFYNEATKKHEDDATHDVKADFLDPLHQKMAQNLPPHINHECLIGYGKFTICKVPNDKLRGTRGFKSGVEFGNGDGVVPIKSAQGLTRANFYHVKGSHAELCSQIEVLSFVEWVLNGKNGPQPDGILHGIPRDKLEGVVLAKLLCPVDTTITDNEGRYVAGSFDTDIVEISPFTLDDKIEYYTVGESKYLFINDQIDTDLKFDINAYDNGVADISLQVVDGENITEIQFPPVLVNKSTAAKLEVPLGNNRGLLASTLVVNDISKLPVITNKVNEYVTVESPLPTLEIELLREIGTKKSRRRPVYSGPVTMKITSEGTTSVAQIFYSINDEEPISYTDPVPLDHLDTGTHMISVFGKDEYNRVLPFQYKQFTIDNVSPMTKISVKIEPEGFGLSFATISQGAKTKTFYKKTDEGDDQWKEVESNNPILLSYDELQLHQREPIRINYRSISEFGNEEELQTLSFSLGNIPELMWNEHERVRMTPSSIWGQLSVENQRLDSFTVNSIPGTGPNVDSDFTLPDDVKGVQFESEFMSIEVMFLEKYSLYFKNLNEVVELGQEFSFSFELLTENTKESILHTNPRAKLHPLKRNLADIHLPPLTLNNGVFHGQFRIGDFILESKYKLVITDDKNTRPSLREVLLIMKEDDM